MERRTKAATETGVYLFVVAAILVVANIISYGLYKRFDLTKNERFTLSQGSARLVREGLKQDLMIDLYVTRGMPKVDAFVQDLIDLMTEYERASNGKVKYTIIEPKTDEEKKAAKEAGLQEANFGDVSETGQDQTTISRGFLGIAFKYGSEKDAIPILSPDPQASQGLEFWISTQIREIRDRADDVYQKFGIITGKDEIKLTDQILMASQGRPGGPTIKGVLDQYFPFYKFEDVDLQNGDAEINKELVGLIITQPGKDFTEKELRRIDQFLMLGGKAVAIFASAVNMKANDASMKAELNTRGLEKLLDGYGIEMKKDVVLDWGRSYRIAMQTQLGQMVGYQAPGIVQAQHDTRRDKNTQYLDQEFPSFFRVEEVSFPFPSTLVPHPEKQPEAELKVVARTTARTTVDTSANVDLKISANWKPTGEYAQRAIAIALEGKIKSAFHGQGDALGIETSPVSKEKSRVLVISASQFLANPFARAGNPPPMPPQMAMMGAFGGDEMLQMLSQPYAQKALAGMILSFKNTLDWMSGDLTLLATSSKLLGESNLAYSSVEKPEEAVEETEESWNKKLEEYRSERSRVQWRVQLTLSLLGPLLFALFGLVRWRMRESARGNISLQD
jgi:ABC-type uncharacterized transport system involved in gliding motility auxiliary subunit